jgi:hypothetical protein
MTSIFLAQTPASASFAEHLRQELRGKGYTIPEYPPLDTAFAASRIERAIVGSAAVILLWESSAASPAWQARHIDTARCFHKPLFPLLLDATPLPDLIAALPTLSGQLPGAATISALVSLPAFPPARASDPLLVLYEQATDENRMRLRRAAIEQAAGMLGQDQHRDALLLLLTYLAEHDPATLLRKEAGKVLQADAQKRIPVPPFSPVEAAMMVAGQCERGHLSYYNRRVICQRYRNIAYGPGSEQRDELVVPCQHQGCPLQVVVHVDCGAYQ